jgi:hypothetical protein
MIDHFMLARFQHSQFALKVYCLQEQSVVDHLRPKISQKQRGRLPRQDVAADLLIFRDLAEFAEPLRSVRGYVNTESHPS